MFLYGKRAVLLSFGGFWFSGLLYAGAFAALPQTPQAPSVPHTKPDFAREVLPILRASCFQCHGTQQASGGLRLDSRAAALKGGMSGTALVPGNSAKSLLLRRIQGLDGKPRMPMGFAPLTTAQEQALARWIEDGAVWSETIPRKHWAYVKPVRPVLPPVKNKTWSRTPIDRFVLARLEKEGLSPAPQADRETMIRRVSLDLTGLPPTPQETDAFLKDTSPTAYEKVVDRLLASPHYGERWARVWLDLARYADTNGYEKDSRRSIYPYRDWVIDAFNRDMPFDQFTIEQIAGDLLPNATLSQRTATGFHRNTMFNDEGGVDREEQRWLTNVDRTGTTASVWLGSTLACAQCHDHKYDPFKQKDFYQILACFEHTSEPALELAAPEQIAQRNTLQQQIAALEQRAKVANVPPEEGAKMKQMLAGLRRQMSALNIPTTLVLAELPGTEATTHVRIKGAFLSKGDLVMAGTPDVLNSFPTDKPRNRLGLATWLVSPDNPLTARVTVNRLWEQYFGQGIVTTSEDFGTQGQPPSHPELLDWLATELMAQKWSLKALHRLIVTSATYRQASRLSSTLLEHDPTNRLLARGPRFRMEAEMIRDNALAASGLLSRKIGGPSVFPAQPDGIWVMPYNSDQWKTSDGEDRYRRSLYTFWRRTAPYPAFVTFDATSREFCTVRRIRTNTPLQALTTLNDPAFLDAARALAQRMRTEGGSDSTSRVACGFRLCTARRPKPTETTRLTHLYEQVLAHYRADAKAAQTMAGETAEKQDNAEKAAWTVVANVLLNLDETLTKE